MGVPGLALAYGLAYTLAAAVALATLRARVGRLDITRILQSVVRIGLACAVMAGVVAVVQRSVGEWPIAQTVAGVGAGGVAFALAALVLRVEEIGALRNRLFGASRR